MLLDFAKIPATRRPNACLACPPHWNRSDGDPVSPVFKAPVERLREVLVRIAAQELRTHLLCLDVQSRQAEFEQRSRILRFPDTTTVAFEPMGGNRSSLAIFSRARYGYWDFAVNRRRVERWLKALGESLGPTGNAFAP